MKKLLLTLVVSIAFIGSIVAQTPSEIWPGFDYHQYSDNKPFCGAVMIDGVAIDCDYEGWDQLEIVAFVGEGENETIRSFAMYLNDEFVLEFGDPYPVTWMEPIYFTTPDEPIHFKMYDHSRGITYKQCVSIQDGEVIELVTGYEHSEALDEDFTHEIFMSFTSPASIDLDIVGYGEGNPGGYYLISSPIGGGFTASQVTNLIDDAQIYDFYAFDQVGDDEGKEWINLRGNGDYEFQFGAGYLYANKNDVTLKFWDEAYEGEGMVELTYAEGDFAGLNLIGNPYNSNAILDREYYVLNPDAATVNNIPVGVDVEIAPMNGVFVVATEAGQVANFMPVSKGTVKLSRLALNLTNSRGLVDRAVVNFGQGRQLPKMQLNNSTKLYIPMDGQDFAVVSSDGMGELPVNFKAETSGSYTISFSTLAVDFSYLHLIDNLNGNDVDLLANPSYSFDASVTDYTSRFKLVFVTSDSSNSDNFAFFSNGSFVINNEGEATLQVVDVAGRILSTETISGCANVNVNAAPGVYMIRLINGDNTRVQKVVVK